MTTEYKLSYTANEIDAKLGEIDNVVKYISQNLSDEQQAQARENIGAVSIEEVEELLGIEEEFSVSGELVEFNLDIEPDTELEVISKIHRDETWGLSDKLVLHQVSGSNFVDFASYLGGIGTVFEKNGVTATINDNSTMTLSGTNTSTANFYLIQKYHWSGEHSERVYPAGTYTLPQGFSIGVRAARYPSNVVIAGANSYLSKTLTISEPFRIILLQYAVKVGTSADITVPLGLFRGESVPETGYEYSGRLHTVAFDTPVYEGEFNWSTGELKDVDGNTVAYYDSPKIKSLPGTNYFWTSFGENTVSNRKNDGKATLRLNETAPAETVPSICDFTLTPVTKNYSINVHGDSRQFFHPNGNLFYGMEVPLITTRGKLIVTNSDGLDECELTIPELINHKDIADIMTSNSIIKRWSNRFYITRDPDFTEKIDDGSGNTNSNPNVLATWIFPKKDFENYGLPVELTSIPIVSPIFSNSTSDELASLARTYAGVYLGTFSYDAENDNYVFKCRAKDFYAQALYKWTSAYFCYPLKEEVYQNDNMISLYIAAGYSVRFEQDNDVFNTFWNYALTQKYCPFVSDNTHTSLWTAIPANAADVAQLIDTAPNIGVFVPRSIEDALYEAEHIAKRLNYKDKQIDNYEANSYNWIGEGDGVTDYTDKIQSKITEIYNTTGGGIIYLGMGTYPISKSLIVYSNTTIIGCGAKTIITQTADNTDAIVLNGNNITLRDFSIHLSGACTELTGCVYTNNNNSNGENGYPPNYYVQNTTIENVSMSGNYKFEYVDGRPILGDVYNNYKGVGIYSSDNLYFNYGHIENVYVKNLMTGVYGGGGSNYFNVISDSCKYGIYITRGDNNTFLVNGHAGYDIDENGEHISMTDMIAYIERGTASSYRLINYDAQACRAYVFLGPQADSNKIYLPITYSAGSGSGTSGHEWNILKRFIIDYGRGNVFCDNYKDTPFHIGSFTTSISKGPQLEISNPVIQNVLSGAGIWGNISSNTEFENKGIALRDVCRYPSEKTVVSNHLPYILSTVAPSVDNPIEILIDYSNRPVIGIPNYIIQFDHRYVASDYVVSFDTTNTGVYDYEIPVTDNIDIVMVSNYPMVSSQYTTYRMKITITKALQIANFKHSINGNNFDYNPDGLIGICNIGMTVNDYAGRSFLGECGGSLYGNVDMHQNTLKNLPSPVDDGDAVSKAYVEEKLGEFDAITSDELTTAINTALAEAKASGEFDGEDGTPGIVWQGGWDELKMYSKGDAVAYNGTSYIYTSETISPAGISPEEDNRWGIIAMAGQQGEPGANGLGIYQSYETNIEEADNQILFSKIISYDRDIQVGDIIILNDLTNTLVIIQEINQDSVTVQKTGIELQGKDGSNGKNGTGIFTARNATASPDGYYEVSIIDYPDGREPIVGDLLIFNDYSLARVTAIISTYEIAIEKIGINIKGVTGQRGTGLLPITTAPNSYTTAVGGITPKYRISLSIVKSEASTDEVYVGDTLRYSYYHYPIAYVDASYAYCTTRVSIRGAAGTTPVKGTDYYTEADKAEMVGQVKAAMPTLTMTGIDEDGVSHTWVIYGVSQA